ncbi:MAG: hypothetical protein KG028_10430 [Actinobacteria bacterium]|jgi:hypothetical protein|nr:hypothetical protein [Actinomycetota bacterium]
MIVRISKSRDVAEHRAWRGTTSLHAPVVAVAPDTRRHSVLLTEQLAAMRLDVEELRGRRGAARLERWWRAWTSGVGVDRVVLVNPQLAHPEALCAYLLLLRELVADIVLLERTTRTDGYEAIMAELEAEFADPTDAPSPAPRRGGSTSSRLPRVPHTGTLTFLAACQRSMPPDAVRQVQRRYEEALETAREPLAAQDPQEVLRLLWSAGASSSSPDELLVSLHAIRVAAWSAGATVSFDPHVVLQRAGAPLLAASDDPLWQRMTAQVDANRATSQCLGVLGWAVDDILALTIDSAEALRATGSLPPPVAQLLRVATAARVTVDRATGDEPLMVDPTRTALDERTVGRWIRLAATDHLAPTIGNHLRRRHVDATQQLRDLGIEWTGA